MPFACVLLASLFAACGGKIAAGGDVSDAAPEVIVEPGTSLPPPTYVNGCPSSAPAPGTSCASDANLCEYGSDPNPACNTVVECVGGAWSAPSGFPACPASAQTPGHACPAPYPPDPRSNAACAGNVGVVCDYRDPSASGDTSLECGCHDDAKLGAIWDCAYVVTGADCPFPPSLLGTSCATEGVSCPRLLHREGWTCGPNEVCTHGEWTLQPCK